MAALPADGRGTSSPGSSVAAAASPASGSSFSRRELPPRSTAAEFRLSGRADRIELTREPRPAHRRFQDRRAALEEAGREGFRPAIDAGSGAGGPRRLARDFAGPTSRSRAAIPEAPPRSEGLGQGQAARFRRRDAGRRRGPPSRKPARTSRQAALGGRGLCLPARAGLHQICQPLRPSRPRQGMVGRARRRGWRRLRGEA